MIKATTCVLRPTILVVLLLVPLAVLLPGCASTGGTEATPGQLDGRDEDETGEETGEETIPVIPDEQESSLVVPGIPEPILPDAALEYYHRDRREQIFPLLSPAPPQRLTPLPWPEAPASGFSPGTQPLPVPPVKTVTPDILERVTPPVARLDLQDQRLPVPAPVPAPEPAPVPPPAVAIPPVDPEPEPGPELEPDSEPPKPYPNPPDPGPPLQVLIPPRESERGESEHEEPVTQSLDAQPVQSGPGAVPAPLVRREQVVIPGALFTVVLSGPGWIYLGSSGPIDFISRERRGDDLVFSFRTSMRAGGEPLELSFELQDLSSGRRFRHEELIMPETPAVTLAERDEISDEETTAGTGAEGSGTEGSGSTDAVRERTDVTFPEQPLTETPLTETPQAETLLTEAHQAAAAGNTKEAIALYRRLMDMGGLRYDLLLFRLASLLEQPGEHRDLEESRRLYREMVRQYPLSEYWERATARIEHLERHYFFIR